MRLEIQSQFLSNVRISVIFSSMNMEFQPSSVTNSVGRENRGKFLQYIKLYPTGGNTHSTEGIFGMEVAIPF